jgi:phage replication-related protein YjqB (UPF0714/DUF867 family)
MSLTDLLAQPGVHEEVEIRGRFGFLAFHGGPVERVTSMIARMAAEASGSTYYSIDQPADRPLHLPSTRYRPEESSALAGVLEHIDIVCTIHGYGREMDRQHLLLGGQNRELAKAMGGQLVHYLPSKFKVITDLDAIPRELRGVHPQNPANRPRHQGVQLEIPPGPRWNWDAHEWADADGLEPTNAVQGIVEALAATAVGWLDQGSKVTDGS